LFVWEAYAKQNITLSLTASCDFLTDPKENSGTLASSSFSGVYEN